MDRQAADRLLNGQTVQTQNKNGNYLCYVDKKILGIVKVENRHMKIDINLWENAND